MASLRVALLFAIACLSLEQVNAQTKYKVCAALSKDSECQAVETDNSDVECAKVADSVDCLVRMSEDKADFILLSAEETILAALSDKADKFSVVASVRSRESDYERFAFQSVAVVPIEHKNGLQGLSQGKLCHPGLGKGKEQLWSDRVLKYFEKQVVASTKKCPSGTTSSADDDANDLNNFFSAACRPGPWVLDQDEDKKLKAKYPKLCSLCGDKDPNCEGYRYFEPRTESGAPVNSHMSAVACLVKAHGTVAYVAYNHVKEYFQGNMEEMKKFGLLCENGTVVPFTGQFPPTNPPCAWVQQPWPAIVARKAIAGDLIKDLKTWIPTGKPDDLVGWKESLANILFNIHGDVVINYPFQTQSLTEYILEGRTLPKVDPTACRKAVKWCTVNDQELSKCSWVQNSALTVGLSPDISCVQGTSHLDCLKQVQDKRADFLSIDTNLGYLARRSYELDPVLYGQTQSKYASRVLAVVKESSGILRWENLKGKSACFPEYGGIAWLAFIRAARERKVISTSECDYASVVAGFFSGACAPGARDPAHFPSKAVDPAVLCSACRGWQPRNPTGNEQGVVPPQTLPAIPDQMQVCPADNTNPYYGTKGALKCLSEEHSNVAFLEGQYLAERARHLKLDPANYRVLCRNGSLAANTGFTVDENCALSVTIDSEIVARRDYENSLSLQLLIQELETWFGYTTNTVNLINLKIFSPFNNTKDLLFKDSTISVATRNSNNDYVKNYVELNKHNDQCSGVRSGAGVLVSVPALATLLMALAVKLITY